MINRDNRFLKIIIMLFAALLLSAAPICLSAADTPSSDEIIKNAAADDVKYMLAIAAAVSVGISCIASAYALAKIGSAALGAMSEKPEIGGRALIFLGMAEGIAIYGLIVAIMIINKM